jgi:hypothetical protein
VSRRLPSERFARYVNLDGPINPKTGTRCHLWTGAVTSEGYGLFEITARLSVVAHRFAYQQVHGLIDTGYFVDHDDPDIGCQQPLCVNVEHLRAVTPFQKEGGGHDDV